MAGVNQLERDLIKMRQKEGIEIAKSQGKYKGRLKKYNKNHEGMNYAVKLYHKGNMTVKQICKITNISKSSLYRRLSEEKTKQVTNTYKNLQTTGISRENALNVVNLHFPDATPERTKANASEHWLFKSFYILYLSHIICPLIYLYKNYAMRY